MQVPRVLVPWFVGAIACVLLLPMAGAQTTGVERRWLEAVHARIAPAWEGSFLGDCERLLPADHPLNRDRTLRTVLSLDVGPDGAVTGLKVAVSAHPDLDRSAQEVMQTVVPLPAPPPAIVSDDGLVHLRWAFPRDAARGGPAQAKVRRVRWPTAKAMAGLVARGDLNGALARAEADAPNDADLLNALAAGTVRAGLADAETRRVALEAVAQAKIPVGWAQLRAALSDEDEAIRRVAIRAAGAAGDPAAAGALLKALGGVEAATAAAALAQLGLQGEAWAAAAAGLDDPERRVETLAWLAPVGASESVSRLSALLRSDAPSAVRAAAAVALGAAARGEMGPAMMSLRKALTDKRAAVRLGVLRGAVRAALDGARSKGMFYRVIPLLRDKNVRVHGAAILAMAALGRQKALTDLVLISKKVKRARLKIASAQALGWVPGPEATARLVRMLGSKTRGVEVAALLALAGRADAEALRVAGAHPLDGLELTADAHLTIETARWRHRRLSPGVAAQFTAAYRAASDQAARVRLCGVWLASR